MRGERIKVKGACFQDDLARLGRKNCWQFRSREEGGIVFDRNHVLHRDSSFGVPELLSPARSIRGEENRHRGEGGFSFVPGSPLAGSDDSNRNGRKRSNQRVPRFAGMRIYIYIRSVFLRFFILASVSLRSPFERKGVVESSLSPSLFLLFQNLFFLPFVFYFVHFQVVAKMLNIKLMFPRRNEDRAKVSSSRNWHISRSPLFGEWLARMIVRKFSSLNVWFAIDGIEGFGFFLSSFLRILFVDD